MSTKTIRVITHCRHPMILELPSDLIVRIISRLPLKSVVRFQVVCKEWRKILTDTYFSRTYLKTKPFKTLLLFPFSKNRELTRDQILVEISENGDCIKTPYKPTLPSPFCSTLKLKGPFTSSFCMFSCNMEKMFYMWNPMVNHGPHSIITLPELPIVDIEEGYYRYDESYLFGYSSAINKYKALKLFLDRQHVPPYGYEAKGMIYTVGVDEGWRSLPDPFEFICTPPQSGCILNGVYHWIPNRMKKGDFIHIFDFGEEKQGLMSMPCRDPIRRKNVHRRSLDVLNDQLCVIEHLCRPNTLTIWIMKEYAVAESWTKIDILWRGVSFVWFCIAVLSPVAILGNGVIVILSPTLPNLFFYDPKLKVFSKVEDLQAQEIGRTVSFGTCFAPLC